MTLDPDHWAVGTVVVYGMERHRVVAVDAAATPSQVKLETGRVVDGDAVEIAAEVRA